MSEHPILFSDAMVRAILDGRKGQTRRILTVPWKGSRRALPYEPYWINEDGRLLFCDQYGDYHDVEKTMASPYGAAGDRLWVREAWAPVDFLANGYALEEPVSIGYRADRAAIAHETGNVHALEHAHAWDWDLVKWRPSIFMPRWASRLTLDVTEVRVQRLQDISEEDARAEGAESAGGFMSASGCWQNYGSDGPSCARAKESFRTLWDSINADRAPWSSNPWVWVVTFKRVQP